MIKLGDKPITDIRIGDKPVLEVYKGEERVWGGVCWNQLIIDGNFTEGLSGYNNAVGVEASVENNILTLYNNPNITPNNGSLGIRNGGLNLIDYNHKLLLMIDAKRSEGSQRDISQITTFGVITYLRDDYTDDWKRYHMFFRAPSKEDADSTSCSGMIYNREKDSTAYYKNFMLFNLTLMYGEGREPNTLEEFLSDYKKWFGKELEYAEYCRGEWLDIYKQDEH